MGTQIIHLSQNYPKLLLNSNIEGIS